jgi:hypothetical protein
MKSEAGFLFRFEAGWNLILWVCSQSRFFVRWWTFHGVDIDMIADFISLTTESMPAMMGGIDKT